jgi:predicted O-methyltransferase YrrM
MMTNNWYWPSDPSSIQPRPWLSDDATAYLESILTPEMNVIEHGSGGSTLWFAARVTSVTAYEQDSDWYREVKARAPQNVTVKIGEFPPYDDNLFDLLLIDGEPVQDRGEWITSAPFIVKPCGWVVLDNANRPEYVIEREWLRGKAELVFTSKLQGQHLITEFYKLHD